MKTVYFEHVYLRSGFDISAEIAADGKAFKPKSTHACLKMGYFCLQNLRESPFDLMFYLKHKLAHVISKG